MSSPAAPARPPSPLWRGGTCVWRIPLDPAPRADRDRHWELLDEHERARAGAILDRSESDRFVVAHGTVRELLGGSLDVEPRALTFDYGPGRRPRLVGVSATWSLSRAGCWAVLAVGAGPGPVGVDVERLDPRANWEMIADGAFGRDENDAIRALWPERRPRAFLRLWAAKEAFVKACGLGLAGLRDVRVHDAAPRLRDAVEHTGPQRDGWHLSGPGGRAGRAWSVPVDAGHDAVVVVLPAPEAHPDPEPDPAIAGVIGARSTEPTP